MWDRTGKRPPWSRPASIDTGIRAGDPDAHWLCHATGDPDACTLARRDFTAGRPRTVRPRAHVRTRL
ncbi:hypothetical protein ACFQ11_24010 [Actinomadura sediminis]|uniref:Uncharacterized protein n=1 Tax=Actinomadura sediminis TaxID=1038904 RepID=A0ABW3EY53_9ACTN